MFQHPHCSLSLTNFPLFPCQGEGPPKMVWDVEKEPAEGADVDEAVEVRWFS